MAAGAEIKEYKERVDTTLENIATLRRKFDDFALYTGTASLVVSAIDETGDLADEITKAIDDQLSLIKLTKLAGPLKTPSKAFEKVLEAVRPVTANIDKVVDKMNGKKDKNDDSNLLDSLEEGLSQTSQTLEGVSVSLQVQEHRLEELSKTMGSYITALDVATSGEFGTSFNGLRDSVDDQLGARNDVSQELDDMYDNIVSKVQGIIDIMDDAKLKLALNSTVDLGDVEAFFDVISDPLSVAAAALKPVEPILDTVGVVVDVILGPIFSFLTNTLGIDALLDEISDDIKQALPDADFFDDFSDAMQAMMDDLREFIADQFGTTTFIEEIEKRIFGDNVGNLVNGPTGFGTNEADVIQAHSGSDIIDARDGNDTIFGGGGNDIFIASEGDDVIDGGTGTDMIYFDGYFSEYELSEDPDTGQVIVTHVEPPIGGKNEGAETISNIEHVVFKNISFTGEELANAIKGASVLEGTDKDDLIFLNSKANTDNDPTTNTNSDGQHVVNAGAGNDRIFGSTQNDELNGESGDDIFIPGGGNDEVNGGSGSNTLHVLAEADKATIDGDLADGFVRIDSGDWETVTDIQNLIIQRGGKHELLGTGEDNYIISSTGDDVVSGIAGDDYLEAGEGDDYVFGGSGEDRVYGGKGDDRLLAVAKAKSGESDYYDGGEGQDFLSYAGNLNSFMNMNHLSVAEQSRVQKGFRDMDGETGRVRITAEDGLVEHLSANGSVIATDTFTGVESFQGSESDDILYGVIAAEGTQNFLAGAGGDDILYANGSNELFGGAGNDTLVMSKEVNGSGFTFDGGGGDDDVLDFTAIGDARVHFERTGATQNLLRAYEAGVTGSLGGSGGSILSASVYNIERMDFGDFADRLNFNPLNVGILGKFDMGGGNDYIAVYSGTATISAGDGADTAIFNGAGSFSGGAGNDTSTWDSTFKNLKANGDAGQDTFILKRFEGDIDGGDGFDTVSVDGSTGSGHRINVNLNTGTILTRSEATDQYDGLVVANLTSIEQVIATKFDDFLSGSTGNDQFVGRGGDDFFRGFEGDDKFYGGNGRDEMYAGAGNDFLHGGAGNDSLDGGEGSDTVSYAYAAPDEIDGSLKAGNFGGMRVYLAEGYATGAQGYDTLVSIENVFGSGGNDTLHGDTKDNILSGEDGDDNLRGFAGDDYLVTGRGADIADGGAGDDTIVIDVGNKIQLSGASGSDTLDFGTVSGAVELDFTQSKYTAEFIQLSPVWADNGGTEVRGYKNQNLTPQLIREAEAFFSNSQDDLDRVLPGTNEFAGNDFHIVEQAFTETSTSTWDSIENFTGGQAGTKLLLSSNVDRFDGSRSDKDFIELSDHGTGINYNFATGATNVQVLANDELVEVEGIYASAFGDKITGDSGVNILYGYGGSDVLNGAGGDDDVYDGFGDDVVNLGSGDDYVRVGGGADTYIGGSGKDYISYYDSSYGITADLAKNTISGSWAANDTIKDFESISGSKTGDDSIRGTSGSNSINTYGGDDRVYAGGGADYVNLGAGDDYVRVGGGKERFYGGEGKDYISYYDSSNGITADLAKNTISGSWAANDTIDGFEGISGSKTGDDTIRGTSGANSIYTYGGDDKVYAGGGSDIVSLGAGDDYVRVGGGVEKFYGGAGKDYISYYDSANGITADLAKNTISGSWAANDTIKDFESISGSKTGDDTIRGTSGSNSINTYGGDDRVYAGGGADYVSLGAGDDYVRVGGGEERFFGGSGTDYISYYDSSNGITADLAKNTISGSWAANDTISSFEGISGSKTGDDTIRGTSGANSIYTYGGDDKVYAGGGADIVSLGAGDDYVRVGGGVEKFYGGSGTDYISYYDSANGIRIDLRENEVSGSWAANDTIKDFESASGSKTGDDTMLGTSGANTLRGYGGDDVFYGRGGADKLYGGAGEDFFDGGAGSGVDLLYGGADADTFHFDRGEGFDIIKDFEDNIDTIELDNFSMSKAEALNSAVQVGSDVVFDFGADGKLIVENTTIGVLGNDLEMV